MRFANCLISCGVLLAYELSSLYVRERQTGIDTNPLVNAPPKDFIYEILSRSNFKIVLFSDNITKSTAGDDIASYITKHSLGDIVASKDAPSNHGGRIIVWSFVPDFEAIRKHLDVKAR